MPMRLNTTSVVAAVAVLATGSATFHICTAPERIPKRMQIAHEVCDQVGGQWTVNERKAPVCKRDWRQ